MSVKYRGCKETKVLDYRKCGFRYQKLKRDFVPSTFFMD